MLFIANETYDILSNMWMPLALLKDTQINPRSFPSQDEGVNLDLKSEDQLWSKEGNISSHCPNIWVKIMERGLYLKHSHALLITALTESSLHEITEIPCVSGWLFCLIQNKNFTHSLLKRLPPHPLCINSEVWCTMITFPPFPIT